MLNAENVTVRYGAHTVVDRLSFSLEEGQWLMLAGPNGAGKSSLISAIAQGVPYEGEIRLNGRNLRDFRPAELARKIAVLAQQHTISYGYTVEEIVQLGRYAHQRGLLGRRDEDGPDAIERALELTGMKMLRKRSLLELSGGEVQRVLLAMALEPIPQILILDEPLSGVDVGGEHLVLDMLDEIRQKYDLSILFSTHDFSTLRHYADKVILLQQTILKTGTPGEVLSSPEFRSVFHLDLGEKGGSAQ